MAFEGPPSPGRDDRGLFDIRRMVKTQPAIVPPIANSCRMKATKVVSRKPPYVGTLERLERKHKKSRLRLVIELAEEE